MKSGFSLIIPYFKRYRTHLMIGIVGLLAVDSLQIFIPWMVKNSIDVLTENPENYRRILRYGAGILLLAIGVGFSRFTWRYFIIGISRRIEMFLRNALYRHLQSLSYTYFDHTSVGDLMAHATNDLEAIRMMCGMAIVASMDAALLMIASLIMMFTIDGTLTLYVLIPMPVITLIVLRMGPLMHARFLKVQERFSTISEKAQETFAGIRVIKSFVQESAESTNFSRINQGYVNDNMSLVKVWGLLHPMIWTIGGLCGVIILYAGGNRVIDNRMTMGDFVAFNSYLGILLWPMIAIGWVVNLYQRGRASLDRVYRIFQEKPAIENLPDALQPTLLGAIRFRDLTFAYQPDKPVLKHINLTIRPGQWVALMGPTGSAKTTLVSLVSRLYDPPDGTVLIDDIDVRTIDLKTLRSQIGVVPQQSFLFSDTISNNIRFGRELTDEQVEKVARQAHVYDDIAIFPERFETLVGERGVTLSGGQKQRVAIARALAAQTPILILDDALSAVDAETEESIVSNVKNNDRNQTVILISHRVSTAREADIIVFLEDGEIAEMGSHQELTARRGRYFEIYQHQKLEEELDRVTESEAVGHEESDTHA
ncbi:ABC transporter ATP-binding protein [bacterium]|nr:ABC transporter ATP-binding protein [candidate division CSSED10-310 bacterium]